MPQNVDQKIQDALRLHQAGQVSDAFKEYGRILKQAPKRADVMNFAGIAALQLGETNAAIKHLGGAAKAFPDDPEIAYNFGIALKQRNNLAKAAAQFERAAALNPGHSEAWNNLGSVRADLNDPTGAVKAFGKAIALEPNNPLFLENLGGAQERLGNIANARAHFERALAAGGDRARLLICIGATFMDNQESDTDRALEYFKAALKTEPGSTAALALIGYVEERRHDLEAAEEAVRKGLQIESRDPLLNSVMARIENRRKEWVSACRRLQTATANCDDPDLEVKIRYELGNVLDQMGQFEEAFEQVSIASRKQITLIQPNLELYRRHIADYQQAGCLLAPPPERHAAIGEKLTFIVGFPRSGTTLVGAMLNGHQNAVTLDERPMIDAVENAIRKIHGGDLGAGLSGLSESELPALREIYLTTARDFGWDGDSILIDKHPLNMIKLDLLGRLFPDALAVNVTRHPLDVCLSCFMQYFEPNIATVHFLKMTSTIELYRIVMRDWLKRRNNPGMKVVNIAYEEIVAKGIKGLKEVVDASSLTWNDNLIDYRAASQSSDIRTPSYRQVSEDIYSRARGRWRNYANHLGNAREALADIGESLGYDMSVD